MPVWIEILTLVFAIGFTMFFVASFTYESRQQTKRIKLYKEILRLIDRYALLKKQHNVNSSEITEVKNKIQIKWKEFKEKWKRFRFKEITRDKIEKTEKFLISERIIKT